MKQCSKCSLLKELSEFNTKHGKPISYCKTCCSIIAKEYRVKNKEKEQLRHTRYWLATKGSENQKDRNSRKCKTYRETHPEIFRLSAANRRCEQLQATPKWSDPLEIKRIYLHCPMGHHVDHIIPIKGELVCGLHVSNNLQYLLAEENLKKSNKYSIKN
jgi:hypothetical protein